MCRKLGRSIFAIGRVSKTCSSSPPPQLVGHPLALERKVGLLPRPGIHPRHLLVHAELLAEVGLLQVELAREEAVDAEAPRGLRRSRSFALRSGADWISWLSSISAFVFHQIVALADELEQRR